MNVWTFYSLPWTLLDNKTLGTSVAEVDQEIIIDVEATHATDTAEGEVVLVIDTDEEVTHAIELTVTPKKREVEEEVTLVIDKWEEENQDPLPKMVAVVATEEEVTAATDVETTTTTITDKNSNSTEEETAEDQSLLRTARTTIPEDKRRANKMTERTPVSLLRRTPEVKQRLRRVTRSSYHCNIDHSESAQKIIQGDDEWLIDQGAAAAAVSAWTQVCKLTGRKFFA